MRLKAIHIFSVDELVVIILGWYVLQGAGLGHPFPWHSIYTNRLFILQRFVASILCWYSVREKRKFDFTQKATKKRKSVVKLWKVIYQKLLPTTKMFYATIHGPAGFLDPQRQPDLRRMIRWSTIEPLLPLALGR